MKQKNIRLAVVEDANGILQIYAPFITQTVVTFECRVPQPEDFRQRIAAGLQKYPWLLCEIDGRIAGYAYAARFHEREAYDWSVTTSVYVDPRCHRQRIGRALYTALFDLLKMQGFYNVYSLVITPNPQSEGLHESFGFKTRAIFEKTGFKGGQWLDVKWYELYLREHNSPPQPFKAIGEIAASEEFSQILARAEQIICD